MTEPGEVITIGQWLAAVIVFAAGSAGLLLVAHAARVVWRRGRSYVTVQGVEPDCGEYE